MGGPVVFVSDLGLRDEFVGVCHLVIARLAPDVRVVETVTQFGSRLPWTGTPSTVNVHGIPTIVRVPESALKQTSEERFGVR